MMNKWALSGYAVVFLGMASMGLLLINQQRTMHQVQEQLCALSVANVDKSVAQSLATAVDAVDAPVARGEEWRAIQERVKDTVVQVFAHIAEIDFLQPYKTPSLYTVTGSAFFINEEGDLITNAHVVNQAKSIWVQIPSLGKCIIDVEVVGISPDRDLALLRVKPASVEIIKKQLGQIPYLTLGNSDNVHRADEVLALGYPLSQQSLKSTSGVISGREHHYIQMSAAINPGSSGGPLLNQRGEVVGINSAGVTEAQNVGYIIPINDLKIVLPDLYKEPLLRKPYLGVLFNNATESLTEFLGNPQPGGCYVVEVVKNSPLYKAGLKRGDMIYEINGYKIDMYGEMNVPWSEDKISLVDYVGRLATGQKVNLVVYRKGARKVIPATFSRSELPAIRKIYPGFEDLDYEIVAGMVVMPLTLNHIYLLGSNAPGLASYADINRQAEPALVVTHIFPNSQLYRSRVLAPGSTIKEINGKEATTLAQLRAIIGESVGKPFLTLKAIDNVARASDNIFIVLPWQKVLEEEIMLARDFRYEPTAMVKEVIEKTFKDINPAPAPQLAAQQLPRVGLTA